MSDYGFPESEKEYTVDTDNDQMKIILLFIINNSLFI